MSKSDDDRLLMRLENKLINAGLRRPCKISVEVYNGMVTVKGMVQYEYQKRAAIHACRTMDGIRSISDQLKVEPPVRQPPPADPSQAPGGQGSHG